MYPIRFRKQERRVSVPLFKQKVAAGQAACFSGDKPLLLLQDHVFLPDAVIYTILDLLKGVPVQHQLSHVILHHIGQVLPVGLLHPFLGTGFTIVRAIAQIQKQGLFLKGFAACSAGLFSSQIHLNRQHIDNLLKVWETLHKACAEDTSSDFSAAVSFCTGRADVVSCGFCGVAIIIANAGSVVYTCENISVI